MDENMDFVLQERDLKIEGLKKEIHNLGEQIIDQGKAHDREYAALRDVRSYTFFIKAIRKCLRLNQSQSLFKTGVKRCYNLIKK